MEPVVERVLLEEDGAFPNNPLLPLLLVTLEAMDPGGGPPEPEELESRFARNGWGGMWRWGVYDFHHYHSIAHEVLGCYRGSARIQFGGPNGPVVSVSRGMMALIPAGVAHCNQGSSAGFAVVGAYPPGQSCDLLRGDPTELPAARARIQAVPVPSSDPWFGRSGPLVREWGIHRE